MNIVGRRTPDGSTHFLQIDLAQSVDVADDQLVRGTHPRPADLASHVPLPRLSASSRTDCWPLADTGLNPGVNGGIEPPGAGPDDDARMPVVQQVDGTISEQQRNVD